MSIDLTPQLNANDWQMACRMTFGAFGAWALATIFGWPYATYYAVYPLVLIGLAPSYDSHVALQYLVSAPTGMAAAGIMIAIFSEHPMVMMVCYFGFMIICFSLMAGPYKLFMYGAMSLCICSALVHFGSYPETSWQDLFWNICGAIFLSVVFYIISFALFPDIEPRVARIPPPRTPSQRRHLVLLCAFGATGSFIFFQSVEMRDSLSAQMATILVLLAMSHDAIWNSGRTRLYGSVTGSIQAVVAQLLISGYSEYWPLTACAFLFGLFWFSAQHTRDKSGSAEGFAAVTALAILYGLLKPSDDIIGDSLYRGTSIVVSISLMLVLISLVHYALNRFASTRWEV